jgi:hypothetical protein
MLRPERSDIHFHDLSANESATQSISIYSYRDAKLEVEKHEFFNSKLAPFVNVSFTPLISDEVAREPDALAGVRMTVELKKGMPYGEFNEAISVTTNQSADSPLQIHLIGNVASDILLVGPQTNAERLLVDLRAVKPSEGAKHTVYLHVKGPYRDETRIEIKSVEPKTEFSATLGTPNRDNPKIARFPLTIEVPVGATPASHAADGAYGLIHLSTTHPDAKEMTIKVRYVVKE